MSFLLVALALLLCRCPSVLSSDEGGKGSTGVFQLAELFSSMMNKIEPSAESEESSVAKQQQLSAEQIMSSILAQFQKSPPHNDNSNEMTAHHSSSDGNKNVRLRKNRSNRRKQFYQRSIRSHYDRLKHKDDVSNIISSPLIVDSEVLQSHDNITYYNAGMHSSFDARSIINSEENIFSRFSHWTYKLQPRQRLSQIHLKLASVTDEGCAMILKLTPTSILSDTVQFQLSSVVQLGVYLDPGLPEYESFVSAVWGSDAPTNNLVEYYVDGDACDGFTRRQSKVIYNHECCERRQHCQMEEFLPNDGHIIIQSAVEKQPCRYELRACNICLVDSSAEPDVESTPQADPTAVSHLLQTFMEGNFGRSLPPMPPSQIEANKMLIQSMFTHAYDNYFYNAFPASELKPLSCKPGQFDLVKIPALTLIDTLDTLIIMGNYTEFARSVERLRHLDISMKTLYSTSQEKINVIDENNIEEGGLFSVNQNVSLFETTIRVLGGLLSAHQMAEAFLENIVDKSDVWDASGEVLISTASNVTVDELVMKQSDDIRSPRHYGKLKMEISSSISTWEYDGFLLALAHDIGRRLLKAFDTATGIPYGTVNLLHGVPFGETTVASLAGAGSLSLEFELLSRLTNDPSFGKAAKLATRGLWIRGSPIHTLYGKHINIKTGRWEELLSGIGSNSDSFYEYLIKHYLLYPEDWDFWSMFLVAYGGVHDSARWNEWYADIDMTSGNHLRLVFESLMAFYPGMQVLLGEVMPASKSLNSFFLVREFLGLLPERFDYVNWKSSDDVHPLRPELLESCYFLHLASIGLHGSKRGPTSHTNSSHHTSSWLWAAAFALNSINDLSKVPCGFATVKNLGPTTTGCLDANNKQNFKAEHLDEMPSYFLSETIKYLYLTFDAENNIIHNDTEREWIFTTEAHPIHYAPVSNSTIRHESLLTMQVRQVRALLNELSGNKSDTSVSVDSAPDQFEEEQWTPITVKDIFVGSLDHVNNMVFTSKNETDGLRDFNSGPPFSLRSMNDETYPDGLFATEINQAYRSFADEGKGNGKKLSKRCPNYHHPDLQWAHALHDSLDYSMTHTVDGESSGKKDGINNRMLTALGSVCFYGTDYYGEYIVGDKRCPIENNPDYKSSSKTVSTEEEKSKPMDDPIPGAKRFNMGGNIGSFDVKSFPGGDGFIVRHVQSQETLHVSIFQSDTSVHPSEDEGTVILAVLTIPHYNSSVLPASIHKTSGHSPRIISSWRSLTNNRVGHSMVDDVPKSDDNTESTIADDEFRRHVVGE